jgi:hypothetical protein
MFFVIAAPTQSLEVAPAICAALAAWVDMIHHDGRDTRTMQPEWIDTPRMRLEKWIADSCLPIPTIATSRRGRTIVHCPRTWMPWAVLTRLHQDGATWHTARMRRAFRHLCR